MALKLMQPPGSSAIGQLSLVLALASAIGLWPPAVALAQMGHGGGSGQHSGEWRGDGPHGGGSWHGTVGQWHGGHWLRGWHGNRFGWWWTVPGYDEWYAYDAPVYPYPAYPDTGYPAAPVAPYYWYYCQSPAGYYPYVEQCAGPWQPVPAPG